MKKSQKKILYIASNNGDTFDGFMHRRHRKSTKDYKKNGRKPIRPLKGKAVGKRLRKSDLEGYY